MRNRRRAVIAPGARAVLAAALLAAACAAVADDDNDPPVQYIDGAPVIGIDAARQRQAGIGTAPLVAGSVTPEVATVGQVVDLQPLVALRAGLRGARARHAAAVSAVAAAREAARQLDALHRDGNAVSARRAREAAAALAREQAGLDLAAQEVESLRVQARQGWGAELAALAMEGADAGFEPLLLRREVLVRVVWRAASAQEPPQRGFVAADGRRAGAQPAVRVGPAPFASALQPGAGWFYRAAAPGLATGAPVAAWLPAARGVRSGVRVPERAVLWHAGRPWVYRALDRDRFVRAAIGQHTPVGVDWFVTDGLQAGDRIVVTGAQVLMSEEQRANIPDEEPVD
ncbi:MAG: hypothetical protein AB7Q97_22200 [Gammaproteobacteria bacterium]